MEYIARVHVMFSPYRREFKSKNVSVILDSRLLLNE
jgi:hypothetical protein